MVSDAGGTRDLDAQHRGTLKSFLSRRLSLWPRRHSDDGTRPRPSDFLDSADEQSDDSMPAFEEEDIRSDSDTQYSDAQSTFEFSLLDNGVDIPGTAASLNLLGETESGEATIGNPNKLDRPIAGLGDLGELVFIRKADEDSDEDNENRLPSFQSRPAFHSLHSESSKGKAAEDRSGWSAATKPWAALDSYIEVDEKQALRDEISRLRAELDALKNQSANQPDLSLGPTEASSHRQQSRSTTRSRGNRRPRSTFRVMEDNTAPSPTTLRELIMRQLLSPQTLTNAMTNPNTDRQKATVTLDSPLTPPQIQEFTRLMNGMQLSGRNFKQPIALCAVCHLPKFKGAQGSSRSAYLSEMLTQLPGVTASAFEDFDPNWGGFNVLQEIRLWIKCPVPVCGKSLPLDRNLDVLGILEVLGVADAITHVRRFERANQLRKGLQALDPAPERNQLRRSKAFHDRLIRYGRMSSLLDGPPPQATGQLEPELLPIDTADGKGAIKIPVFKHLLKRKVPHTCVVCDETYQEFARGDETKWNRIIKGYGGEWTWRILSFPTKEILPECEHDHDICRECLATFISTQIQSRGHGVVDNIICATPDCSHRYSHEEIRCLAAPEVFATYDRYATINSVRDLPNFRGCLRDGCDGGGLYDGPAEVAGETPPELLLPSKDPNNIMCIECGYHMCFTCQTPWHKGLRCAEATAQREHGDPHYGRTQDWLAQNTKPCPGAGCGVQVAKGEGCFHMTCSRCRFEFCWECLADWSGILVTVQVEDGRNELRFQPEGHREGCYFRGEDALLPTQVMGNTLEEGGSGN
ncbi:capsule polysaccharide synthase Cps1 [Apiospora arundinis]